MWYHYDVPKVPLGASLLLMNIGMQAGLPDGELDNDKGVLFFSFALVFEVRGTKGIASYLAPRKHSKLLATNLGSGSVSLMANIDVARLKHLDLTSVERVIVSVSVDVSVNVNVADGG